MYIFCPLAKTFITWEANLSLPLHIIYIVYHNIYISIYIYINQTTTLILFNYFIEALELFPCKSLLAFYATQSMLLA